MQKDTPKTIGPAFDQAGAVQIEQKLKLRIEKLPPKEQDAYKHLRECHERALDHLRATLTEERPHRVDRLTQDVLNEKMDAIKLGLHPKYLPSYSKAQLAEAAKKDAEVKVTIIEIQRLSTADGRLLEERVRFVSNAEDRERYRHDFKQKFQDKSRGLGEGNER